MFFKAQEAKHAGKCLESMVSADPKALKSHKKRQSTYLDGSIKPWTVIHQRKGLKSSVCKLRLLKIKITVVTIFINSLLIEHTVKVNTDFDISDINYIYLLRLHIKLCCF